MSETCILLWVLGIYACYRALRPTYQAVYTELREEEPRTDLGTIAKEHTAAQAAVYGWALTVTKVGITRYDYNFAYTPDTNNLAEIETTSCIILLNKLRDEHPNSDVADQAANLIITLGMYAKTI